MRVGDRVLFTRPNSSGGARYGAVGDVGTVSYIHAVGGGANSQVRLDRDGSNPWFAREDVIVLPEGHPAFIPLVNQALPTASVHYAILYTTRGGAAARDLSRVGISLETHEERSVRSSRDLERAGYVILGHKKLTFPITWPQDAVVEEPLAFQDVDEEQLEDEEDNDFDPDEENF